MGIGINWTFDISRFRLTASIVKGDKAMAKLLERHEDGRQSIKRDRL